MSFFALEWQVEAPGFYVEVSLIHGDSDAITTERLFFSETEDDMLRLEMFRQAFPHLAYYCVQYPNKGTEFIIEKIVDKTQFPYDALYTLLEPLIQADATSCDTGMAAPSHYTFRHVSPDGVSRLAIN